MLRGFANCSLASFLVRWGLRCGPGFLPLQVGAGDDAGQDAQPRLHPVPLAGGVLRFVSPWGLSAGGPGCPVAPRGTLRFVSSGVVSHILSLRVCDRASVSGCGIGIRVMSFTFYWFGLAAASAYSPTPLVSVGQQDCGRKLPVRVINSDNPYGPPGVRPFCCCTGGVQENEFWYGASGLVVSKLKQEAIAPLWEVSSEQLELRAGSGLPAEIPINVGVRDGASTGSGVEKVPNTAGDVPVRYALLGPSQDPYALPHPHPLQLLGGVLRGWRREWSLPARCLVSPCISSRWGCDWGIGVFANAASQCERLGRPA